MSKRLTFYERQRIEYWLGAKVKITMIARILHRDHSVISREVRRNTGQFPIHFPYSAVVAQRATNRRSRITNTRKLVKDEKLRDYVEFHLKHDWSPEQISGRLKDHPPINMKGKYISDEAIYDYIYDKRCNGQYLYKHLRKAHYVRHKQCGRKPHKVNIPEKVSIHQRPQEVINKARLGDWESDLLCFSHPQKQAVSVQYERKSQYISLTKVASRSADDNEQALIKTFELMPHDLRLTLTFDNGGENAKHTNIRDDFNIDTYFCDSYSSWQKGGIENINGLLRQYLPRKTDIGQMTYDEMYNIQQKLNQRPRKSNSYLTPTEVMEQYVNKSISVH